MREIISEFGTAVLAASITGALLMLLMTLQTLNRSGIGGGIGNIYSAATADSLADEYSGSAVENYKEMTGITIRTKEDREITAGEEFALSDRLEALDAKGNTVPLRAIRIEDKNKNLYYGRDENGETYVCLENPGFYTFWVVGEDANGVLQRGIVQIPVQTEEGAE